MVKGRGLPLEALTVEDRICQTEDDEGRLNFLPALTTMYCGKERFLQPEQTVALALTEVCCEIGSGKVWTRCSGERISTKFS